MLGAIALVPLAFLAIPPVNFWAGLLCALIVGLGAWQTKVAWRFAIVRDHATARAMLYVSLFYLPLTMLLISISFWVGRS
jgi:heme O synthase-like polyprenyltransferase